MRKAAWWLSQGARGLLKRKKSAGCPQPQRRLLGVALCDAGVGVASRVRTALADIPLAEEGISHGTAQPPGTR